MRYLSIISSSFLIFFLGAVTTTHASRIEELKENISARGSQIKELEKEIKELDDKLKIIGDQSKSLAGTIKELDITRRKLSSNIKVTEQKISITNLNIERLDLDIDKRSEEIKNNHLGMAEIVRLISLEEGNSVVEILLSQEDFGGFWNKLEQLENLQKGVKNRVIEIKKLKKGLETDKSAKEIERTKLLNLKSNLADQKKLADINRVYQNKILRETKNKESGFKKLLAEKIAKKNAVDRELLQFEAELKIEIDPSKLPSPGKGILAWPLDNIIITQYFGETALAKAVGRGLYGGKGHNGIDLRASIGTPVKASAGGIVRGTGDTDLDCDGASYGKWILIEHRNGLTTLYAHLSLIKVSKGQEVSMGDNIGYTGSTGYSTGPHLHLGVFASQGVTVGEIRSKVPGCRTYRLPLAAFSSYLNPLLYL